MILDATRQEIEKAWKMVDSSHEKEARAKETISQLKTEISNLSRLVEQGAGLSVGQVCLRSGATRAQRIDDLAMSSTGKYCQRIAQGEGRASRRA